MKNSLKYTNIIEAKTKKFCNYLIQLRLKPFNLKYYSTKRNRSMKGTFGF